MNVCAVLRKSILPLITALASESITGFRPPVTIGKLVLGLGVYQLVSRSSFLGRRSESNRSIKLCSLLVRLYATKTEINVICHYGICFKEIAIARSRIREHPNHELIFRELKPRCLTMPKPRGAGKRRNWQNPDYGRTNSFTCHSLRHTFITHRMEASGNNVALVILQRP